MTLIPCSLRIIGGSPMEWFEPSKTTIFEGSVFLGLDNCGKSSHLQITLPTTNIVPEKWRLKDYFPFGKTFFQGLCKFQREGNKFKFFLQSKERWSRAVSNNLLMKWSLDFAFNTTPMKLGLARLGKLGPSRSKCSTANCF